jgi:hydrogenase-4 component F
MMSFGMLSFLVAAILLHRQNNIKRLFSYSSVEHMGLMTFAFGIGGNLATFGAVFYMVVHSLTKSAIFMNVGNIIQICKTQSMDKIHGLLNLNPMAGWGLLIASFAISGLPPFGIFTAELLLVIAAFKSNPLLAILLLVGFVCAFTGLIRNIQPLVFGTQENSEVFSTKTKICSSPVILHLLLVAVFGLYLPQVVLKCIDAAVKLIAV